MYLVFTRTPVESHGRRLKSSLLCSCDIFRALINSLCLLLLFLFCFFFLDSNQYVMQVTKVYLCDSKHLFVQHE